MKNFLAIYIGTPNSPGMERWNTLDEATRKAREQEGVAAWFKWGEDHADSIVDNGGPLGKTKSVGPDGVTDIRNAMGGYTVVRAETHEDAARLFLNHPQFTVFPGERVEIMEVLPLPPM